MNLSDIILFEGKTMADLAKEIYINSQKKTKSLQKLVDRLETMAETKHDVASIGITLTEGYKQAIANDEQLIKLATVVQRIVKTEGGSKQSSYEDILSQEEKDQLWHEAKKLLEQEEGYDPSRRGSRD